MKRTRFTDEQIIGLLAEHDAGTKCADLCRKHGMSEGTFYNWKAKLGGMTVPDAKRLKALEDENARLKKLLAEQMPDMAAMKVGPLRRHWFKPNGEGWQKMVTPVVKREVVAHLQPGSGSRSGGRAGLRAPVAGWSAIGRTGPQMERCVDDCASLPTDGGGSVIGGGSCCCGGRESHRVSTAFTGSTAKRG